MKNLVLLILGTVLTFSIHASTDSNNSVDVFGNVKTAMAKYLTVVNKTTATVLTRGMAVCPSVNPVGGQNGVGVDLCLAEGDKPIGVVVNNTCAVNARCELQTKGYFAFGKFTFLATPAVAGKLVYAGVDGSIVKPAAVAAGYFPVGVGLQAAAASSSVYKVLIDL